MFGAGVGTIPWLLLGELCPSKVKGIASGVTVSVAFVMIFAVVKIFPYGLEYLSPAGTYGFFAGVRTFWNLFIFLNPFEGECRNGNIHDPGSPRDEREEFVRDPDDVRGGGGQACSSHIYQR